MQTFADMQQQLRDSYTFSSSTERLGRLAKVAVIRAYNDISYKSTWNYLRRRTQICLVAPYTQGTVTFVAATRTLTLTGGTWPANITSCEILLNRNIYAPQTKVDSTHLILLAGRSPVVDITSPVIYSAVQTIYPLSADFQELRGITEIERLWNVVYMTPEQMLQRSQMWYQPSNSLFFTILGGTGGQMVMQFTPPPATARTFDIIYQAKPRPPVLNLKDAFCGGTCAVTAGSTTVTITGATLPITLARGCVFRIGNAAPPTGSQGDNPWVEEHLVASLTDSTHFELLDPVATTASGVKYTLDDPIDIEPTSMQTYFNRKCEAELLILHQASDAAIQAAQNRAYEAMIEAKEADSRMNPAAIANSQIVTSVEDSIMGLVGFQQP